MSDSQNLSEIHTREGLGDRRSRERSLSEGGIYFQHTRLSSTFQQLLFLLSTGPPCPGRGDNIWSLILITPAVKPVLGSLGPSSTATHASSCPEGLPVNLSPGPSSWAASALGSLHMAGQTLRRAAGQTGQRGGHGGREGREKDGRRCGAVGRGGG